MDDNNNQANENITINKNKISKFKLVIITIIILIILIISIIFLIPLIKYRVAISLTEQGNYDKAVQIFTELDDYKDSKKLLIETINLSKITKAKQFFNEGKYIDGYNLLKEVDKNEEVINLKTKYGKIILDQASKNIITEQSNENDYTYFRNIDAKSLSWSKEDPYFEIYISQNKYYSESYRIILNFNFIGNKDYSQTFQTPLHPINIIFTDGKESVNIPINMFERYFEHNPLGWDENIAAEINILEYNALVKLLSTGNKITVKLEGIFKNIEYILSDQKIKSAITHSDFINAVQVVYGVNENIDSDKVKNETNLYEQAVGVMLNSIEVIEEIGVTNNYLTEFKEIYNHIKTLENEQNEELINSVTSVYNSCIKYYEYTLNPTVDMSACPGNVGWAVNVYINTYINTYKSQLKSQMNKAISDLNDTLKGSDTTDQ